MMSTGLPGPSTAGRSLVVVPAASLIVSRPGPFAAALLSALFSVAAAVPLQLTLLWTQNVSAEALAERISASAMAEAVAKLVARMPTISPQRPAGGRWVLRQLRCG